jgi:hypothetical protein
MGGYVAIMTIPNFLGLDHWQTFSMAGAYVLAGEIASSGADLAAGISRYEDEVREYVLRNQAAARLLNDQSGQSGPGDFADYGTMVEDLPLKNYPSLLSTRSDH